MGAAVGFNTQPPEGGWKTRQPAALPIARFNTQPPEGGWGDTAANHAADTAVSTHSRPKAAGKNPLLVPPDSYCFNTQPPEGGWLTQMYTIAMLGSFNTQPPEGGWFGVNSRHTAKPCFNTQPPEGGWV